VTVDSPGVVPSHFIRFLALLAVAIQVALGPVCLNLEVCHGSVQLLAADGSSCCFENESCTSISGELDSDGPAIATRSECPDCYDVEFVTSDEPIDAPRSVKFMAPPVRVVLVAHTVLSPPQGVSVPRCDARAPPGATTPTGLLPGAFPPRI